MKANISPLNPQLLKNDPAGFLPDGFGPVNVILRFEENLPNEGCALLDPNINIRTLGGAWDPCTSIPNSEQYRVLMTNNANGFSLIGRTTLVVDDQIVYTSEVNPLTGQVEEKDLGEIRPRYLRMDGFHFVSGGERSIMRITDRLTRAARRERAAIAAEETITSTGAPLNEGEVREVVGAYEATIRQLANLPSPARRIYNATIHTLPLRRLFSAPLSERLLHTSWGGAPSRRPPAPLFRPTVGEVTT